ncbi:MAG: hypothetical protein ACM3PV_04065 [Betaproteobacteria bacterium]|jgi:hypothetical protein
MRVSFLRGGCATLVPVTAETTSPESTAWNARNGLPTAAGAL